MPPRVDDIAFSCPNEKKLTGAQLADIYRGVIKKWNDPLLAKTNAGVTLPNLPITVVHRSDGSGTTYIFSTFLSTVSADFKAKIGAGTGAEGRWARARTVRKRVRARSPLR